MAQANPQTAAADAYAIGEAIEALAHLLDKFYAQHGEELGSRLCQSIPWHEDVCTPAAKEIYAFARSLEPVAP